MNQQDHKLAPKIVQFLDSGTQTLDPAVQKRLVDARKAALAHYREKPEPAWSLAGEGRMVMRFGGHRVEMRHLIAIAVLIAGLIGVVYWQTQTPVNEIAEIDLGLLTDDLPLNAYLDRGFDSWLKRSSR